MQSPRKFAGRIHALMALFAFLATQEAAVAQGVNSDLGSTARTQAAPVAGTIRVGGVTRVVHAGDMLTPAELTAMLQVAAGGQQQLNLGATGAAVGGRFNFGDMQGALGSLVIPHGVTGLQDFRNGGAVNLSGLLNNAGNVFAFSTNPAVTQGVFNANAIINQASGVITSRTPYGVNALNLVLNSNSDVVNHGLIESVGGLTIGSSKVLNDGLMKALGGNVNFVSPSDAPFVLNNIGGTISAVAGDINVRDASYAAKSNATIGGGVLSARNVNVHSGDGTVNVSVDRLDGRLNIGGGIAHVTTGGGSLVLGDIILTGDPTFYNTAGDVVITGALIMPGQHLAIVAAGDIYTGNTSSAVLSTNSANGTSGDITLVSGALFTSTGSNAVFLPTGDSTSNITITGGNTIGGKIDLTQAGGVSAIDAGTQGGAAGKINIIAFGGTNAESGTIKLPSNSTVSATASAGIPGSINIIAGGDSTGSSISVGNVTAQKFQPGAANSSVTISARQPSAGGGVSIFDGAIIGGSFSPAGALSNGSITAQNVIASSGPVVVESGNQIKSLLIGSVVSVGSPGGSVTVSANSSTPLIISSLGAGANQIQSVAAPAASGNGGSVIIRNSGAGGITLAQAISVDAGTSGSGGTIVIDAAFNGGTGPLVFSGSGTQLNANGTSSGSGGSVTIATNSTLSTNPGLFINAKGATGSAGGNVFVSALGPNADINGTANVSGNVVIIASGINGGGNITMTAGRDLNLSGGNIFAGSNSVGNGGNYNLTAGRNLSFINTLSAQAGSGGPGSGGTVQLTAGDTLNVANIQASGSVNGGTVTLTSGSSSPFVVGSLLGNALGSVSAVGPNGGTVNIRTTGSGGVSVVNSASINVTGNNAGNINIDAGFNGGTGAVDLEVGLSASSTGGGNGGSIDIRGDHFIVPGQISLGADGFNIGNGGNISLRSTSPNFDVVVGSNVSAINAVARSGASGGNGGSITVESGRDITGFIGGPGNFFTMYAGPASGVTGNGGSYTMKAGGKLGLFGSFDAQGKVNGNGGLIDLESDSAFPLTLTNTPGAINKVTSGAFVQGAGNGNGGTLILRNAGTGGINLATANLSLNSAGNGSGSDVVVDAPGGTIFLPNAFATNAAGGGARAGNVTMRANTFSIPGGGTLFTANGSTNGSGGTVSLESLDPATDVAVSSTGFKADIRGGTTSGASGGLIVKGGRDVSVDIVQIFSAPSNGNGASFGFTGGRNVAINGGLNASASGTGNGGSIVIESNSVTPFNLNGGGLNSVNGGLIALAATNGAGGTIIIKNASGAVQNGAAVNIAANSAGTNSSPNAGFISIEGTSFAFSNLSLLAQGGTNGRGGTVKLTTTGVGANVAVVGGGIAISVPGGASSGDAGTIDIKSGGDIQFNGAATGVSSGKGATIKLAAANDINIPITLSANGNNGAGGTIDINAGHNVQVLGNLTANGSANGSGGFINVTTNSSSPFTLGGSTVNSVNGIVQANGIGSGDGGTAVVTALGSGGILANIGSAPISVTAGGTGNGGNITLDASKSGGTGDLYLGNSIVLPTFNASSNIGRGGNIDISGVHIFSDVANPLLKVSGATAGTISISATGANSNVRVGPGGLLVDIGGTKAGTLNVEAGGSILFDVNQTLINGSTDAATINLHAGKAGVGVVQIFNSIANTPLQLGGFSGGTLDVSFNDPTGSFVFGASGGGSFAQDGVVMAGQNAAIHITNTAGGAPLAVQALSNSVNMVNFGTLDLAAPGDISLSTSGTMQHTTVNASGASFTHTALANGVLQLGNINTTGGITVNELSGGSILVAQGGQLNAGGVIQITTPALFNNGTISGNGIVSMTGVGVNTILGGLGHWEVVGPGSFISINGSGAGNSILTVNGSQTLKAPDTGAIGLGANQVTLGQGVSVNILSNTPTNVTTNTLVMQRFSRLNGAGITSSFLNVFGPSSNLVVNIEDGFSAMINTASATQGIVGINGNGIVTYKGTVGTSATSLNVVTSQLFGSGTQIVVNPNFALSTSKLLTWTAPTVVNNGAVKLAATGGTFTIDNSSINNGTTIGGTGSFNAVGGQFAILSPNGTVDLQTGTNWTLTGATDGLTIQSKGVSVNGVGASLFDTGSLVMTSFIGDSINYSRSGNLVTLTLDSNNIAVRDTSGTLDLNAGFQQVTTIGNSVGMQGSATLTLTQANPVTLTDLNQAIVTIIDTAPVTNAGDIFVSTLNVTTPEFKNNGDVQTIQANISSPGSLTISGTGTWSNGTPQGQQTFTAGGAQLIFAGDQTFGAFNGGAPANFNATGPGQSVVILPGVTVKSDTLINVNTPFLDLQGALIGNPVRLNSVNGAGTIANTTGDLVLPSPLVFNGKNLAILSSGNIIAPSKLTKIDLSSATASGGSLTIAAGVAFTPVASPAAPGLSSQTFTITGLSPSGGSILMPTVNLLTSTKAAGKSGGVVTLVAAQSLTNAGTVQVGAIDTSATTGTGGSVKALAPGGFISGAINTKGGSGGSVSLANFQPSITGVVTVTNGTLGGSGSINTGAFGDARAAISVGGPIATTGTIGGGGNVSMFGRQNVEILGPVNTSGLLNLGNPLATGGIVSVQSGGNVFIKGNIDTHAGTVNTTGTAGGGGLVNVGSKGDLIIAGNVITTGGSNIGSGNGGAGGGFFVFSGAIANGLTFGTTSLSGFLDTRGGNSAAGNGGAGGGVVIDNGVVQISGANKGVSINASSGTGGVVPASGMVNINTYSSQTIPTNFDLTSAKQSVVALPGAMFTVGLAKPVNGVAGTVVSGGDVANGTVNGTGRIHDNDDFNQGQVHLVVTGGTRVINEGGQPTNIDPDNAQGVRRLVTPAEAVALYQQTATGSQPLLLTGGAAGKTAGRADTGSLITVDASDVLRPFTAFKLQAVNAPTNGITLTITGANPLLQLPKAGVVLGGTITMPAATDALIDFNGSAFTLPAGSAISVVNTGRLVLANMSSVSNSGTIEAGDIVLGSTKTAAVKFTTNAGGITRAAAGAGSAAIIMDKQYMAGLSANFIANAATFSLPVEFASLRLPTGYKSLAQSNAKNAAIPRSVALTFALMDPTQAPLTATVQGITLNDKTISIKSLPVKVGTTTVQTGLAIGAGSTFTATNNVVMDSANNLTVADNVTISGGTLKTSAPLSGVLAPTDIVTPGSVTLGASGSTGITFGNNVKLIASGSNVSATARAGGMTFGNGGTYQANGGRVVMLALNPLTGGDGNDFYARSTTATANSGGGIEIGSGLITSKSLDAAFKQPKNTNPPFGTLGLNTNIVNSNGVVLSNRSAGGLINLSSTSASNVVLNHGAIVFDAINGKTVTFGGGNAFHTDALKPISERLTHADDFIVDTEDD